MKLLEYSEYEDFTELKVRHWTFRPFPWPRTRVYIGKPQLEVDARLSGIQSPYVGKCPNGFTCELGRTLFWYAVWYRKDNGQALSFKSSGILTSMARGHKILLEAQRAENSYCDKILAAATSQRTAWLDKPL